MVADSCEHSNEPSDSIKSREFLLLESHEYVELLREGGTNFFH
jgi:hypothetical protein